MPSLSLQQRPVILQSSAQNLFTEGHPGFFINGSGFTLSGGDFNSTTVTMSPVRGGVPFRLPIVAATFSSIVVDIPPGQGPKFELVISVRGGVRGWVGLWGCVFPPLHVFKGALLWDSRGCAHSLPR